MAGARAFFKYNLLSFSMVVTAYASGGLARLGDSAAFDALGVRAFVHICHKEEALLALKVTSGCYIHGPGQRFYGHGPPEPVMVRPKNAQYLLGSRNFVCIKDRARDSGVVAPVDRLVCAVGIDCPDAVCIAEVAVHVFPACIEYAPVSHEFAVVVKQRILCDLINIRSVRFHAENIGCTIPAAQQ